MFTDRLFSAIVTKDIRKQGSNSARNVFITMCDQ